MLLNASAKLINAIMDGDNTTEKQTRRIWYINANDISEFLGSINPYWSTQIWRKMFFERLCFIETEVKALINEDYEKAVNVQDMLKAGALEMAHIMASGIFNQFFFIQF